MEEVTSEELKLDRAARQEGIPDGDSSQCRGRGRLWGRV